jgi:hypothetical protein
MLTHVLRVSANVAALASAAAVLLTHPMSAQAHRRLEFAAVLGAYVPTSPLPLGPGLFSATGGCSLYRGGSPCPPGPVRQQATIAVGAHLTAWVGNRAGVQGALRYAPSGVSSPRYHLPADILTTSLQFVMNLAPKTSTASVLLMAGPALIRRWGDAYAGFSGTTAGTGVVSGTTAGAAAVGIGIDVHLRHHVAVRAQIEDYMYRLTFASGTAPGIGEWQHDVMLSLSISPFGGRP